MLARLLSPCLFCCLNNPTTASEQREGVEENLRFSIHHSAHPPFPYSSSLFLSFSCHWSLPGLSLFTLQLSHHLSYNKLETLFYIYIYTTHTHIFICIPRKYISIQLLHTLSVCHFISSLCLRLQ